MLFEPGRIGSMELKNRIVMPAMGLGYFGGQLLRFYEERAKGGVSMIVVGPTAVDKDHPSMVNAYDDKDIPKLKELAECIKKYTKVALQLWHPGRYGMVPSKLVSASDIPAPIFTKSKPRALKKEEILAIEEEYADSAYRAKKAGYDAVEILCATGYLISQFLSPATNKRDDEYGGSLENRMRFLLEIIELIRGKIGNYPLLCRISGDEMVDGGNTLREQKIIARYLEDAGVDALNVNVGWHESRIPQITMSVPRGGFIHLAASIKKEVGIPVIASHRINDPLLAEKILKEGKADFVAMARALIADPELPNKAKEGRFSEIRYCIACNQGCFDNILRMVPVSCFMNPLAGREGKVKVEEAEKKKRIVVVGGGPAGMEASIILARRGHEVVLYEKKKLGGQLNLAAIPPGREEFLTAIRYLEGELRKNRVEVKIEEATREKIMEEGADAVILATGSSPVIPSGWEGIPAHDVLSGREVGNSVIIIGGGGIGCETAIWLASRGKNVTILEQLPKIAQDVGPSTRWTRIQVLQELGIKVIAEAKVRSVKGNEVSYEKDASRNTISAESIVIAVGMQPDRELYEKLKGKIEVHEIGDCRKTGKAIDAIRSGFEVGRKI